MVVWPFVRKMRYEKKFVVEMEKSFQLNIFLATQIFPFKCFMTNVAKFEGRVGGGKIIFKVSFRRYFLTLIFPHFPPRIAVKIKKIVSPRQAINVDL